MVEFASTAECFQLINVFFIKKPRSFYGAGLNKNLKLNKCDYAFLRRSAMSEARPPKPAKASVVGSGTT
jgi:hypothetical protein